MSAPVSEYRVTYRGPLPELSDAERRVLLRDHQSIDGEWRDVRDEETKGVVERRVPLPFAICYTCRTRWGEFGCPTYRALFLLNHHERQERENARRISELTEALTPRFGVSRLKDPANNTIGLRMQIDEYSLMHGGMPLVAATLEKMGREFAAWFKKVGDLQRIRADHLHALTLDSAYYTFLTTEFDPFAPFEKRPGAPWEDPTWRSDA